MAVDIEFRLSGGAANANPLASLGGAMSSVEATPATLFDTVASAEAVAGDVEYRCLYVLNNGATTATGCKIWVQANTPSPDTDIAIALGGEGLGGTAEVVGNENTAPSGESFSSPADAPSGLSLGTLAAGAQFPIWLRRTVAAGAEGSASDTYTIRVGYDYIP